MDGVLVDTVPTICTKFGINIADWPRGVYTIHKATGYWPKDFFDMSSEAWVNLPKTSFADSIMNYCWDNFDCYILSSAVPSAMEAKVKWLHKHYEYVPETKIIFAWQKELLAREGHILVDDCEQNCFLWDKAGGRSVIVPQPWNWSNIDLCKVLPTLYLEK